MVWEIDSEELHDTTNRIVRFLVSALGAAGGATGLDGGVTKVILCEPYKNNKESKRNKEGKLDGRLTSLPMAITDTATEKSTAKDRAT